jgi:hypothetical protein
MALMGSLSSCCRSHDRVRLLWAETVSSQPVASRAQIGRARRDRAAGGLLAGITDHENEYFLAGKEDFEEADEVTEGLGPTLNLDSCGGCHSQPAIGGTSPAINPQVAFATANGGRDLVPSFLSADGPVREVRFIRNPDGTPDGGVHALFTITGRDGAGACQISQPDFARELANRNVIFRIPTPTFGLGLVEQIPDSAILANMPPTARQDRPGDPRPGEFHGRRPNHQRTDEPQRQRRHHHAVWLESAEQVAADLLGRGLQRRNGDQQRAVSERTRRDGELHVRQSPQQHYEYRGGRDYRRAERHREVRVLHAPAGAAGAIARHARRSAVDRQRQERVQFGRVRLLPHAELHDRQLGGRRLAQSAGAAVFGPAGARHGPGTPDGVSQGQAGPREFRTAPLWGLGQRIFFLHDGRTSDLAAAIRAHQSIGSEANGVIQNFLGLTENQKQDLYNFLRSL